MFFFNKRLIREKCLPVIFNIKLFRVMISFHPSKKFRHRNLSQRPNGKKSQLSKGYFKCLKLRRNKLGWSRRAISNE